MIIMSNIELKTLKDLEMGYRLYVNCVDMDILRQEAIKWIKTCPCKKVSISGERDYCYACMRFRVFFNITEEELK